MFCTTRTSWRKLRKKRSEAHGPLHVFGIERAADSIRIFRKYPDVVRFSRRKPAEFFWCVEAHTKQGCDGFAQVFFQKKKMRRPFAKSIPHTGIFGPKTRRRLDGALRRRRVMCDKRSVNLQATLLRVNSMQNSQKIIRCQNLHVFFSAYFVAQNLRDPDAGRFLLQIWMHF